MNRLIYLLLGSVLCSFTYGCGSNEETKEPKKSEPVASAKVAPPTSEKASPKDAGKKVQSKRVEVGDPNKVFGDYLKSRSVGYTFQGEIRSAFIRLTDEGRKTVAAEMQQFMAQ